MNNRIKQLAEQAGYHPDVYELCKPGMEKFAELIIRDCIDCVNGYTKPRTFDTHYDAVEQIKANFGVNE
jgi:hypothetical protein